MFDVPTHADLDRNLLELIHATRKQAQEESAQIASSCAAKGLGLSGARITLVTKSIDALHAQALNRATLLICDFAERMRVPISQLIARARPHLQNLANTLLAEVPEAGRADAKLRAQSQCNLVFEQRLSSALRDLEIGFIGGRSIMTDSQTSQSKALRLLQAIYDKTRARSEPVIVTELGRETGLDEAEAQAAWRYLVDRRLIEKFSLPYAARINAAGIDAIEGARQNPDQPISGFPSVTYNIVNNTTNIGSAVNSPVQQAGAHSTQHQVTTYAPQDLADLNRLVSEFENHIGELNLDQRSKQKANAQIATLRAQLSDEPNQIIIQQAGHTLRNITEGAIGSLVATAAQPAVWQWVSEIMARLF